MKLKQVEVKPDEYQRPNNEQKDKKIKELKIPIRKSTGVLAKMVGI